jgi:hypothetical protein
MKKYIVLILVCAYSLFAINYFPMCEYNYNSPTANKGQIVMLIFAFFSCSGALIKFLSSLLFLVLMIFSVYKLRRSYLKSKTQDKSE